MRLYRPLVTPGASELWFVLSAGDSSCIGYVLLHKHSPLSWPRVARQPRKRAEQGAHGGRPRLRARWSGLGSQALIGGTGDCVTSRALDRVIFNSWRVLTLHHEDP